MKFLILALILLVSVIGIVGMQESFAGHDKLRPPYSDPHTQGPYYQAENI